MNDTHGLKPTTTPSIKRIAGLLGLLGLSGLFLLLALPSLGLHYWLLSQASLAPLHPRAMAGKLLPLVAVGPAALWLLPLGLPLFNRIDHEEILRHQMRSRLMRLAHQHPGLSAGQAMRKLRANRSTMVYHLDYLARNRLLKVVSTKAGFRHIYPPHYPEAAIPGNTTPKADQLLDLIRQNPGSTQRQLAQLAQVTKQALTPHLTRLMLDERITWVLEGRTRHYYPQDN